MACEIITGGTGTLHVTSADDRECNAGEVGLGSYVYNTMNKLACTMSSANKAVVSTGAGIMQGTRFRCATPTELTIQNGTQGQRRNDLIVATYLLSGGKESVTLEVVKGTPTDGATATDPSVVKGDILAGAFKVQMPLWRIPLNGLSVGTPVALFDVLTPMADIWDSVSHTGIATEQVDLIDYTLTAGASREIPISPKHVTAANFVMGALTTYNANERSAIVSMSKCTPSSVTMRASDTQAYEMHVTLLYRP